MGLHLRSEVRPSGVVVREAGSNTKGLGFDSRVRHGCQTVCPFGHHQGLRPKLVDGDMVLWSFLGRASRPRRSEFSVFFSETREIRAIIP